MAGEVSCGYPAFRFFSWRRCNMSAQRVRSSGVTRLAVTVYAEHPLLSEAHDAHLQAMCGGRLIVGEHHEGLLWTLDRVQPVLLVSYVLFVPAACGRSIAQGVLKYWSTVNGVLAASVSHGPQRIARRSFARVHLQD